MKRLILFSLFCIAASGIAVHAQDVWNNGGNDSTWSNTANWSQNAVPTTTSTVTIGTQPTGNTIGVDTGATTIGGFSFSNSLTGSVEVEGFNAFDSLTVNGAISNLSTTKSDQFQLPVTAGANATYAGGFGLQFETLSVDDSTIGTSGSVSMLSGGQLIFDIDSSTVYGSISSISASGATIEIGGTYTGHAGDTFHLTTGNFAGATIGDLPTLSAGLTWNTSAFLSSGTLTVVPEPSSGGYIAISLAALAFLGFRRARAMKS